MQEIKKRLTSGQSDLAAHSYKSYYQMTGAERQAFISEQCEAFNSRVGNLNEQDGYDCPICRNKGQKSSVVKTGRMINGEPEYIETVSDCICKSVRASLRRMQKSGLSNVLEKYTFANFNAVEPWQKALKDSAQRFVANGGGVFFVGGQSGGGKTHICTAITGALMRRGKAAYYMLWQDEVIKLKSCVTDDEYQKQIARLKNVDVLYIDDFLKPVGENPKPSAADIRIAYELINYRYSNGGGVTIISSERYVHEILEIDEATGGRLIEYAGEYITNIKRDRARNYRLRNLGMV